ncbi:DUF4251 domain-containing protein [Labilibacter sediminis]|nr:DUF4251 domain-containing protein [Labilibacter sediminis]
MVNMIKYFLVFALLLGVGNVWSQDKLSRKEKKKIQKQEQLNEMIELVKDKNIEFVADRAFPSGWRSIDLISNPNYLRLSNDSAKAEMPYFGRAYQSTPGERGGINFDNKVSEKEMEINEKKGRISLSFEVKENNDVFRCQLDIFHSGSASLTVVSNNRQTISYNGNVEEWKPEEKK